MSSVFEDIADLDKFVHEPARLAIMTALSACKWADFTSLTKLTGLSKGNLSSHLSKLEDAHLLRVEKKNSGNRTISQYQLTIKGTQTLDNHWAKLDELRRLAKKWDKLD